MSNFSSLKSRISTFLLIFLFLSCFMSFPVQKLSAQTADSTAVNQELSPEQIKDYLNKANELIKQATAAKQGQPLKELNALQQFLVLLPLLLFCLFVWWLLVKLKREGFRLSDALSGDNPVKVEIPNPSKDPDVVNAQPFITITQFPKSTSRLVAFMSGIISIVLAVCLICFFIFSFLRTGTVPDLSQLMNVFLPLGIGSIPYAVKQFSGKSN
jgi:flagellar biogenesis protein FliO